MWPTRGFLFLFFASPGHFSHTSYLKGLMLPSPSPKVGRLLVPSLALRPRLGQVGWVATSAVTISTHEAPPPEN